MKKHILTITVALLVAGSAQAASLAWNSNSTVLGPLPGSDIITVDGVPITFSDPYFFGLYYSTDMGDLLGEIDSLLTSAPSSTPIDFRVYSRDTMTAVPPAPAPIVLTTEGNFVPSTSADVPWIEGDILHTVVFSRDPYATVGDYSYAVLPVTYMLPAPGDVPPPAFPNPYNIGTIAQGDWTTVTATAIPEPATLVLGLVALGGLYLRRRLRK